jgi:hypothetical protein
VAQGAHPQVLQLCAAPPNPRPNPAPPKPRPTPPPAYRSSHTRRNHTRSDARAIARIACKVYAQRVVCATSACYVGTCAGGRDPPLPFSHALRTLSARSVGQRRRRARADSGADLQPIVPRHRCAEPRADRLASAREHARGGPSGPRLRGIGPSGIGPSGIGPSGIGASGIGLSVIGLSGIRPKRDKA